MIGQRLANLLREHGFTIAYVAVGLAALRLITAEWSSPDFHDRLIGTATLPHGLHATREGLQMASLDHAMWFHRPFRADDWLLYVQESTSASGARGFSTGRLFTRDGRLVVSMAQEGLIRPIVPK